MTDLPTLYTYWRSSAAWRVRIALHLKGIAYRAIPVSLIAEGGQQHAAAYAAVNPARLVPSLVLPDGTVLTQSLAIIDWLEAAQPAPSLLPADPVMRARVLAVAHTVAMDIHPVNNLRVLTHLESRFGASQAQKTEWMQHWMATGFDALETMIRPGPHSFGPTITLADLCLIPQLYNAHRWGLSLAPWPRLQVIEAACLAHPAFADTAPERQPDAV